MNPARRRKRFRKADRTYFLRLALINTREEREKAKVIRAMEVVPDESDLYVELFGD